MQRKRGDKSLLLFCVHVCVHRGEALPLIFACLSVSRAVLVPPLSHMAPVYLPISLSLFSLLFLPVSLPLHHTTNTALSPTCLSVAPSKE